uniref:RRM domain-containing protein n=1 Tax=Strongyloides venezuelensis TaxID=75913 RepID=A0A0K0F2X5_STRVS
MATTNLKVEGLRTDVSKDRLKQVFGSYGPLVNVNVLDRPLFYDSSVFYKNKVYIQFSSVKDAIRAQLGLDGKYLDGTNIKVSFTTPLECKNIIYSPPPLEIYRYKKNKGVPFNANLLPESENYVRNNKFKFLEPGLNSFETSKYKVEVKMLAKNSIVPVWEPLKKREKELIDQFIVDCVTNRAQIESFIGEVVRMVENLSKKDKLAILFKKLFTYGTKESNYFIWRSFSLMNGDTFDDWTLNNYRIFKNGPIWVPPKPNFKSFDEMPEFLYHTAYHHNFNPSNYINGDRENLGNGNIRTKKLTGRDLKRKFLKRVCLPILKKQKKITLNY